MQHFDIAKNNPKAMQDMARRDNPPALALASTNLHGEGFHLSASVYAVASIIARAYWVQINGHWRRNGL
jgi:hypothetical protein